MRSENSSLGHIRRRTHSLGEGTSLLLSDGALSGPVSPSLRGSMTSEVPNFVPLLRICHKRQKSGKGSDRHGELKVRRGLREK